MLMRNLLGRLHARPAADLDRIGVWWRVPLGRGGREAPVGPLYRAMTEPRTVRDAWQRLTPDEADIVRLLTDAPDHGAALTVAELAERLGVGEDAARATATTLYRVGVLAREGDGDPIPVGREPRLFLPRELALLFRRVLDEIDLGDRSATPLRALVAWLDDGEIDDAARRWGVPLVPGTARRDDLTRLLLRHAAAADRIAAVAHALPRDARALWERLRAEPEAGLVALATVAAAAGLDADDPPAAARLRHALAELEQSLLAWHTYTRDGQRWLFVPAEIRAPRPAPPPALPPLVPVVAANLAPPPRHRFALPWDLLTLLREVVGGGWSAEGLPPKTHLRPLGRRLWFGGVDAPPPGYLALLLALARAEGLLAPDDARPPRLRVGPGLRAWRELSFAEQEERLRTRWLALPEWVEAVGRDEVEVWGADWRTVRRRLQTLLADDEMGLPVGEWRTIDSVVARLAARDPALLGARFTAATARIGGEVGAGGDREEARLAAVTDVARIALETAFTWFGAVELADVPGRTRAVRLTPRGRAWAIGGRAPDTPAADDAEPALTPVLTVEETVLVLRRPAPARLWALSAFADAEALAERPRFQVSAASLGRALAAGLDLRHVTAFLERQTGAPLPPDLAARLTAWARAQRRLRVRRALLLTPDEASERAALLALAAEQGWRAAAHGDRAVLLELPAPDAETEAAVLTLLRARGFAPLPDGGSARRTSGGVE